MSGVGLTGAQETYPAVRPFSPRNTPLFPMACSLSWNPPDELLAGLDGRCFHPGWSARAFSDLRRNPAVMAATLKDAAGTAAAFVCLALLGEEAEIHRFGVVPERRREGWGRKLLEMVLQEAGRRGAARVFLEVRAGNEAAIGLYEACGFQAVARRAGYFTDPPEDGAVLRCDLPPAVRA